jgi:hypothetical protein
MQFIGMTMTERLWTMAVLLGLLAMPKEIVDSILSELPVEKQGKKKQRSYRFIDYDFKFF